MLENILEEIKKERIMELNNTIQEYRKYIEDKQQFMDNLEKIVELNLNTWLNIAKINNLAVDKVEIKGVSLESIDFESLNEEISIPDVGRIDIGNNHGTVIFVDISKSTDFFKEKNNYTSFVIFNSYISLVKSYVRLSGGEFLEHTGDGSLIFYAKDILDEYKPSYKNKNLLKYHPLDIIFYIGYLLQNKAKEKGLLDFSSNDSECYSLVHIGAAYGEVLDVNLGDMRKMISNTVWQAANNCKDAPRKFIKGYAYDFKELPIKI